jgi:hypothetical protein
MIEKVRSIAIVFVLLGLPSGAHEEPCAEWRAYSRRAAVQQVCGIGALSASEAGTPRSAQNSQANPKLNGNSGASYRTSGVNLPEAAGD